MGGRPRAPRDSDRASKRRGRLSLVAVARECSAEHVHPERLATALANLTNAIVEVEALVTDMKAHRDPLASHIYATRRTYRNMHDTKSGKRHAMLTRTSWQRARELGFPATLHDWERLIAAGE